MKSFLRVCYILTVLGLLLPVGQAESETIKFTYSGENPPATHSELAIVRWQKAMQKESNGELDMAVFSGGVLGGADVALPQLSANEIQVHCAGPVVVHHLAREYQCMESEFVYADEAHGFRTWTGPLGKELSRKLESQFNVTIIGVASRGARHYTSNVPLRTPADFKGLKVRVTNPLRIEILKSFGALPAPLSFPELYGALQTGVFDAEENPISTIWGSKFYEVQKYISLTGHVQSYWVISANKKFLDSLSPQHRKIFMDTLNESLAWQNSTVQADIEKQLKMMEDKGMIVIKPDIAAFQKAAEPIVRKYASEKCRPGLLDEIAKYK